ncbi:MAG: YIP1 family protein [Bacteroidota bacterium]
MRNPFAILLSKNIFERIELEPTWGTPFLIVVGGTSLLAWLKSCWRGTSFVADFSLLGGAFISMSIALLAIWSMIALLLYFTAMLFNPQKKIKYRSMLSLVSICGIIFLIGELLNFILVRLQIIKMSSFILPNRFPIGLDLFLVGRQPSLPLAIFLHSINPIIIWYFATLSLGLCSVTGMSKNSARFTAVSLWAIGVGSLALIASILGGTTIGIRVG